LDRILTSLSDGERAVLLFSCEQMPAGFRFERVQDVRIVTETWEGYYVPETALHTDADGTLGVYILRGGVVCFRRIEVLYEGAGYRVAAAYDPEREDPGTYLRLLDEMIVAGSNLFDGRILSS
jgi:hypothetical protein